MQTILSLSIILIMITEFEKKEKASRWMTPTFTIRTWEITNWLEFLGIKKLAL